MSESAKVFRIRVPATVRSTTAWALIALCLFPLAYLVVLSISRTWTFPDLWPRAVSLHLWRGLVGGSAGLGLSLLYSCLISVSVAFVSTFAGYITGRFIAYHPRRRGLLLLAYIPFVMSPVILGTCLMFLYLKAGLAGTITGVILAQSMFAYGFSIVFFSAFWNDAMRQTEYLVYTLGGSVWHAFRKVLLPISKGMLLVCFFQTFLISWFQYGLTLLVGAGKVKTLPIQVYAFINEANIYYAALASCLLILPPALLLVANKRLLFKEGFFY